MIAGYSLGGKIAFEAAHALQRAGGNVGLVLLVDARALLERGYPRTGRAKFASDLARRRKWDGIATLLTWLG